jgi:hypothetical protein
VAGAFGGLLAYGLTRIENTRLDPWGYIFLGRLSPHLPV